VDKELTKKRAPKRKLRGLTADERNAVGQVIKDQPDRDLWVVALTTGMRFGELAGLKWGAVDLKSGVVSIEQTVSRVKKENLARFGLDPSLNGLAELDTKNEGSVRRILVPDVAWDALRRRRAVTPVHVPWVFAMPDWGPIYQSYCNRRWHTIQTLAGIPPERHVRMHDTRRTAATLEKAANMPKETQARMGWSGVDMMLHYQDVEDQRPVVDVINRALEGFGA